MNSIAVIVSEIKFSSRVDVNSTKTHTLYFHLSNLFRLTYQRQFIEMDPIFDLSNVFRMTYQRQFIEMDPIFDLSNLFRLTYQRQFIEMDPIFDLSNVFRMTYQRQFIEMDPIFDLSNLFRVTYKRPDMEIDPIFGTPPHNHTVLWNAMIHPLLNMTIYGAIWYQGENCCTRFVTYYTD